MPNKTFKSRERFVAALLGGDRNPLSGSASRHTAGDVISDVFFVEQKHRKAHTIWSLFDSVRRLARKERKLPIITLTQYQKKGCLVVIHSDYLEDFCIQYMKLRGEVKPVTSASLAAHVWNKDQDT